MLDTSYTASDILVLEGLEGVRKRPAMYIGTTGPAGLNHLILEVIDNSIDEAMAGFCKEIKVFINKDNTVEVIDDGRGIPVDIHQQLGISALEVVMTKLHAGGKFNGKVYRVSGGLHGVGVSVVNALSEWLIVEIKKDGQIYRQRYERGMPVTPVEAVDTSLFRGTKIRFKPDPLIFEKTEFDYNLIRDRVEELAYLNKGLMITLEDRRVKKEETFLFEGGISSFITTLIGEGNQSIQDEPLFIQKQEDGVIIESALIYTENTEGRILSFANSINTQEGGTHLIGFRGGMLKAITSYAKTHKIVTEEPITSEDVREGLYAVISIRLPEPEFEGQTKTKLGNVKIRGIVEKVIYEDVLTYFERNPETARRIIDRVLLSYKSREAAKKARELTRKKVQLESSQLPGKLAECSEKDPKLREIFIVEGESAGGSAKQARDRLFQAILPLKGKILNVEKTNLNKVIDNSEIQSIIGSLGVGMGEKLNLNGLRYHKVVIMTDADVDGSHIRTLILTLFYRYFRELIDAGYVYIAQPPLYKTSRGKQVNYFYSDAELEEYSEKHDGHLEIQRFKGLGEMSADELWITTMDPEKRNLLKVIIEDAERAAEILSICMGEKVEPRRDFIEKNAFRVRNLDV
ncbi:MAG: DNA gyrase subunit B [candidate division WS2 bacterium]|nr:DNA gyrase subunit B [Candidatus Psychracetigena formicireducens]MBT9150888.1 DNA gyrase subunit B [Candidatus Psychracetigena formicireducens]